MEASGLAAAWVLNCNSYVENFHDLLVRDIEIESSFRADYLLEDQINKLLDSENSSEENRDEMIGLRGRLDELEQE